MITDNIVAHSNILGKGGDSNLKKIICGGGIIFWKCTFNIVEFC